MPSKTPEGHPLEDQEAASSATHRQDYPEVEAWLDHASSAHPWVQLLDVARHPDAPRPSDADAFLGPLQLLIRAIQDAQPQGMTKARERFAKDLDAKDYDRNLLATRLELLCGAHLAWQQIPFGFGGHREPDLVWHAGTAQEAWLEVHRGDVDAFSRLRRAITDELEPKGATLRIRLEGWPLKVLDRNRVLQRISDAADRAIATGEEQTVAIPELGTGVTGVVSSDDVPFPGMGRASVEQRGAVLVPSDEYQETLAAELVNRIEVKAAQARRGSWGPRTALLIDISAARYMRALGRTELVAWLEGVTIDWSDNPYAGVAICFTDLHSSSLTGFCRYRPELETSVRECLEPTLTAIGLSRSHP